MRRKSVKKTFTKSFLKLIFTNFNCPLLSHSQSFIYSFASEEHFQPRAIMCSQEVEAMDYPPRFLAWQVKLAAAAGGLSCNSSAPWLPMMMPKGVPRNCAAVGHKAELYVGRRWAPFQSLINLIPSWPANKSCRGSKRAAAPPFVISWLCYVFTHNP